MNTSSWRSRLVDFTITAVVVALGLQFAVRTIESILPKLVVIATTVGVAYFVYVIAKYRRSQW